MPVDVVNYTAARAHTLFGFQVDSIGGRNCFLGSILGNLCHHCVVDEYKKCNRSKQMPVQERFAIYHKREPYRDDTANGFDNLGGDSTVALDDFEHIGDGKIPCGT